MLNILCLYNATQTFTNTVFEHVEALGKFSENRTFFCHSPPDAQFAVDLANFDAICVHYSIRLAFDQLSDSTVDALKSFKGLKFLFIQDEYDNTHRTWSWINALGIQLVFTVVPEQGIAQVYPPEHFPHTRFVTNLTGYVPSNLANSDQCVPPSERSLIVGYRGRPLPVRYGRLGFEKVEIGRMVRAYCEQHGISSDIAWTEEERIYGAAWPVFMGSCRAMLGSESGANVFNWDGQLESRVTEFRKQNPDASDEDLYQTIIRPIEIDGVMNQVSPRVFEAIAARTVLVLFEGEYSGVVRPNDHFIPLRKDGSNLADVFAKLGDGNYVDEMAERAYQHVIGSGRFDYESFAKMVDREVAHSSRVLNQDTGRDFEASDAMRVRFETPSQITTAPIRAVLSPSISHAKPSVNLQQDGVLKIEVPVVPIWAKLPDPIRAVLRPVARRLKHMFRAGGV